MTAYIYSAEPGATSQEWAVTPHHKATDLATVAGLINRLEQKLPAHHPIRVRVPDSPLGDMSVSAAEWAAFYEDILLPTL